MKDIHRWTFGIFTLLTLFSKGSFLTVPVLVNQPATIFSNARSCEKWTKKLPTEATIATCQNHHCNIEEDFQEKFEFENTSNNLVLKSAKYSDRGTYAYICGGIQNVVKLKVLAPVNVTVPESDNITLMCYVDNTKDVTWFYNDTRILQHNINGSIWIHEGFEHRLSLKENSFKDGDLSLTILVVRKTDAGLYLCFADDEATEGYPHAHMVHVKESHTCPGGKQTDFNVVTTIIISVLSFLIIIFLSVKLYRANTSQTVEQNGNEPSENNMMTKYGLITQPVQESESDPKSSSTQPF